MKNHRKFLIVSGIFFVIWVFSGSGYEKYVLEYQMKQLCEKDGGVKIYETVTLPSEMFNPQGDPFPGQVLTSKGHHSQDGLYYSSSYELGADYRDISETFYLNKGKPISMFSDGELSRDSEKIIRISDNKLMGEAVTYGRSGGETILLWHPSSNRCPILKSAEQSLIRSVFIKKGN